MFGSGYAGAFSCGVLSTVLVVFFGMCYVSVYPAVVSGFGLIVIQMKVTDMC